MVLLAFAVNSIEFICSSAIPVIFTQTLALHPLSMVQHYGYIALYDLFFMLDDMSETGILTKSPSAALSAGADELHPVKNTAAIISKTKKNVFFILHKPPQVLNCITKRKRIRSSA